MTQDKPVLLIDGRAFSLQTKGGVSQIWARLLAAPAILEAFVPHLFLYPGHERNLHLAETGLLQHPGVRHTLCPVPPSDNANAASAEHDARRRRIALEGCGAHRPVAVINTYYGENILPDCDRYIVVVHDFAHEDLPALAAKPTTPQVVQRKLTAMRAATDIVYISCFSRSRARALYPDIAQARETVIYHGHDTLPATAPATAAGTPGKMIHIGTRGVYKSFEVIARAVAPVLAAHPRARLSIIGGEPADDTVTRLRAAHPGQVSFATDVSDARILEELASAEVFLSASAYEGFGIPLLNAMHLGVRPIVSAIPPYRELAALCADFFAPGDAPGLQALLERHFSQPVPPPPSADRPWSAVARDYADLFAAGAADA